MTLYRDEAIVLRTHDLGEADRIITMLTRRHGKVRAVAKGVRRTMSRFGARLEPFAMVDVQLYEGKSLDTVTQVETINPYGRTIARDYEAYTAASAIVETADKLADEGDLDPAIYLLLMGALNAMARRTHHPDLILNSFILRSMAQSGWALGVYQCAHCGAEGPHEAFNVQAGGAVCQVCRPVGSSTPSIETWQLMAALVSGDWNVADSATAHARKSAAGYVAAYLQWHLERKVRSLHLVSTA